MITFGMNFEMTPHIGSSKHATHGYSQNVTTQVGYNIDIQVHRKKYFTQKTRSLFTQSSQRINNKPFAFFAVYFALFVREIFILLLFSDLYFI